MTPTKAEQLAARLESGWCPIESPADMERAAAELRRLAAVEADHDRLMENHNNLHANAARDRAERDALLETFAKVCARLDIDTEAARKQPGKPSDVLIGAIDAEQDALKVALECERMRVVACGVVACSDTPKSAAVARDMLPVYRSASCDDVARRVDECIRLRAERDALLADAERYRWLRKNVTEQPLDIKRFSSELASDTRLIFKLPRLISFDSIGQQIEFDAAIDAAMKGTK